MKCRRSILCFGDSLTSGFRCGGDDAKFHPYAIELRKHAHKLPGRGWGDRSGRGVLTVTCTEAGNPGCSARDMVRCGTLSALMARPSFTPPDVVVILLGTNDLRAYPTPSAESILDDLASLAATAASHGARAVLLTVPPMPGAEARSPSLRERRLALNALILAQATRPTRTAGARARAAGGSGSADARANTSARCIDVAPSLDAADSALWDKDGLHLSKKGYNVLGRLVFAGLAEVLLSEAAGAKQEKEQETQEEKSEEKSGATEGGGARGEADEEDEHPGATAAFLRKRLPHARKMLNMMTMHTPHYHFETHRAPPGDATVELHAVHGDRAAVSAIDAVTAIKRDSPSAEGGACVEVSVVAASPSAAERAVCAALASGASLLPLEGLEGPEGQGQLPTKFKFAAVDRSFVPALERAAMRLGCRATWREPCALWYRPAPIRSGLGGVVDDVLRPGDMLPPNIGAGGNAGKEGKERAVAAVAAVAAVEARVVLLDRSHAAYINDQWKYKSETSLAMVEAMLGAGPGWPCVGIEVRGGGVRRRGRYVEL